MRVGFDENTGRMVADVDDLFQELLRPFEEMPDEAVVGIPDIRRFLQMTQDAIKLTALEND